MWLGGRWLAMWWWWWWFMMMTVMRASWQSPCLYCQILRTHVRGCGNMIRYYWWDCNWYDWCLWAACINEILEMCNQSASSLSKAYKWFRMLLFAGWQGLQMVFFGTYLLLFIWIYEWVFVWMAAYLMYSAEPAELCTYRYVQMD